MWAAGLGARRLCVDGRLGREAPGSTAGGALRLRPHKPAAPLGAAATVEDERGDVAIAIEPVRVALIATAEAGRPVLEERPFERERQRSSCRLKWHGVKLVLLGSEGGRPVIAELPLRITQRRHAQHDGCVAVATAGKGQFHGSEAAPRGKVRRASLFTALGSGSLGPFAMNCCRPIFSTPKFGRRTSPRGRTKRRSCAPLFCEMRRSSTYSGSGDLRASTGPGPSENLTAPFDHPGLSGARSWSASSLVLGCFLPRKGKAAWMTQALYPPMSFWPPEDQLLHYACTGFYGDEAQSICESTTEEVRELAEPSEEATESDEAMACKVPSSEVLVVAKVPAPRPPPAPRPNTQHPSPPDTPTHPLLPRRIWSGQPYERR